MNFYDEAIETKHNFLKALSGKAKELRRIAAADSFKAVATKNDEPFPIEEFYDQNITALRQADAYFWEPRITQLVMASGQQLPETVQFSASWLPSQAGWWWFGRSSPLIGLSKDSERKYCHALLYSVVGDSVHVNTYSMDGSSMGYLGSFVWRAGEALGDLLGKIQATIVGGLNTTPTIKIHDIIKEAIAELGKDKRELDRLGERIAQVNLRKKQLETVLTDEGKATLDAMKDDEERLRFLEMILAQHIVEHSIPEIKDRRTPQEAALEEEGKQHREAWRDATLNALVTFACGCLWLQQKIVVTDSGVLSRAARRRLERADLSTHCLVVRLRKKEYVRHKDGEAEAVDWAWQWAVRGHWRDQPTKEGVKLIWIHPFIKGPEDKPLKPSAVRVFDVSR